MVKMIMILCIFLMAVFIFLGLFMAFAGMETLTKDPKTLEQSY